MSKRTVAVHDSVGWDDRKTLASIWQDHAPFPDKGLTEDVYAALIAVAAWGAGEMFDLLDGGAA